jgi:2,3-bisphosphoglycerate-independent phosphoglycerate mutase
MSSLMAKSMAKARKKNHESQNPPAPPLKNAPVVLAVLDGWGVGPENAHNAIFMARTPFLDDVKKRFPTTTLQAHGRYVGLLPYQAGNSEAGHMNIGAGRVVRQEVVTVTEAIKDGTFFKNTAFREALKHAEKYGTTVHVMGLLTDGNSAHASPEHLFALLRMCNDERIARVRLHLFTDGRDSPPFGATSLLHDLEKHLFPHQEIATVMGRFYAMDRNKLWQRTSLAYHAIVCGEGVVASNAHAAITHGYSRGESDEFIMPSVITDAEHRPVGLVEDNDVMLFFNLRSDRARQITKSFVQTDFERRNDGAFKRRRVPKNIRFAAMTEFGPDLENVFTAFPSAIVQHGLTETLARHRQFYIAESEKFAHVTYFFNGGYADPHFGEERMRVPSRFIPHHDSAPEMRAQVITAEVMRRLRARLHDLIVINYANADMVGHTGNFKATVKAVECVDSCLKDLANAVLEVGGTLVIVGDHGNAEVKVNEETGEILTEHTANPVPFHVIGKDFRRAKVADGMLADVAPTILDIMDVPKPTDMTGFSLLRS